MPFIFLLKIDIEVRRIRTANIWNLSRTEGRFWLRKRCKIEVQNCRQTAHCKNPCSIPDFSRSIQDGFIKHPSNPIQTSSSASKMHFYNASPRAAFFARFYWLFFPLSQCYSWLTWHMTHEKWNNWFWRVWLGLKSFCLRLYTYSITLLTGSAVGKVRVPLFTNGLIDYLIYL